MKFGKVIQLLIQLLWWYLDYMYLPFLPFFQIKSEIFQINFIILCYT